MPLDQRLTVPLGVLAEIATGAADHDHPRAGPVDLVADVDSSDARERHRPNLREQALISPAGTLVGMNRSVSR